MNNELTHSERLDLFDTLVDVVEDWLEKKGIVIDNPEKKQDASVANIYGDDYASLTRDFEETLIDYDLIPKEKQKYNVAIYVMIEKMVQVEAVDEDDARDIGVSKVRRMFNSESDVTDIHAGKVRKE